MCNHATVFIFKKLLPQNKNSKQLDIKQIIFLDLKTIMIILFYQVSLHTLYIKITRKFPILNFRQNGHLTTLGRFSVNPLYSCGTLPIKITYRTGVWEFKSRF